MIFKIKLHWQILIALIAAIAFGYFFPDGIPYISWMGVIFLRALNMVVVPLILSSIISGVSSIGGGSNLGRLGFKTISFYIGTSLVAILTGLFFGVKLFSMKPLSSLFGMAFSTFLLILGNVTGFLGEAGEMVWTRIFQLGIVVFYVVIAFYLVNHFIPDDKTENA